MAGRKYLLILLMAGLCSRIRAQGIDYQQADSTTYALYLSSNWAGLIDFGQKAIAAGNDFPLLRMRMGYAYFNEGRYAAAMVQYNHVLKADSYNELAHECMYWCKRYLNQDEAAAYHASYLDTISLRRVNLSPFGLVEAGVETGVKVNDNYYRGTADDYRVGLSNRLGWRLQLDESIAYLGQAIKYRRFGFPELPDVNNSVNQFEYYGKLNYTINGKWIAFGGYHYQHTQYRLQKYHNHFAVLGLKYQTSYATLQMDADLGDITNHKVQQYNAQVMWMPYGNLDLYFVSHTALLHQNNASSHIFSQVAGTRVLKWVWLDADVTFGRLNNYTETEGLYVYNAIDVTKFKAGATSYLSIGNHALLFFNYTYEQKDDFYRKSNYNQYSMTGGLKWKF